MRIWRVILMGIMGLFMLITPVMAAQNVGEQWLGYYKGTNNVSFDEISRFINAHSEFPAMNKLRAIAERAMPSNLTDQQALMWFSKNPPQTYFGVSTYAAALIRANQQSRAKVVITDWWEQATLSKEDQAKAYNAFGAYLTKSANENRLRRLIYKEQYTSARALAFIMGGAYITLAEARIGLESGSGNGNGLLASVPMSLQSDEGLLFDRLQWRRRTDNDAGAIEILNHSPKFEQMYNPEDWGKERSIIARRLFEEGKYAQAYKISADHGIKSGPGFAGNEWMAGWLALEYLNKPWNAFEHFERLYHNVETPISKSRAAYWAGLSSERLGHPEVAQKWYEVGSKFQTTFYGQLSGQKLGGHMRLPTNSYAASASIKNSALASAARWLRQNGYKAEATQFLNKMIDLSKTPGDYAAVAEISDALSMKNIAIKSAQECEKTTGHSMVAYAFPKIERYMGNIDVEWALVHALVRQESRYDAEAVSTAGARGLMQLMPGTAKEVAKKAGLTHQTDWLTTKPAHNVQLGTLYLEKLLNQYDGNYAMALAAYNAGPGRVYEWTQEFGDPRDPKVDLINWIEMIPIYETRNYVQRVLEGVQVYRQTLQHNKNLNSLGTRTNATHLAGQ